MTGRQLSIGQSTTRPGARHRRAVEVGPLLLISDRSIGARSLPRRGREQHWPSADVEASAVKRSSEKVAAWGQDCTSPRLAMRAVKYRAGAGASYPAFNQLAGRGAGRALLSSGPTAKAGRLLPANPSVDDLGSVQDALKMSTDGQPSGGLRTAASGRPGDFRGVTVGRDRHPISARGTTILLAKAGSCRVSIGIARRPSVGVKPDTEGNRNACHSNRSTSGSGVLNSFWRARHG